MTVITRALEVAEPEDPVVGIGKRIAEYIDDIEIGGQDVLVAVYEPSKDSKLHGLYLPDNTRQEWRWQGITGFVLKVGPLAYKTEKTEHWFCNRDGEPTPVRPGEWVMVDVKNSHPFNLGEQPCRIVGCQYVMARIKRYNMIS